MEKKSEAQDSFRRGEFQQRIKYAKHRLSMAKDVGNREEEAAAFITLTGLYNEIGYYKQSVEYAKQTLNIAIEVGDREWESDVCYVLAWSYYKIGDYEQSIECAKQALSIAKKVRNNKREADAYNVLAWSYYDVGDYKKSIECAKQALSIEKKVGSKRREAVAYNVLAWSYNEIGDYKQSIEYGKPALSIAKEVGNVEVQTEAYIILTWSYYEIGDYKQSIEYGNEVLRIAKEVGDREREAAAYNVLACSYCVVRDYKQGIEYGEQALNIAKEVGNKKREAAAYNILAWSYNAAREWKPSTRYSTKELSTTKDVERREGERLVYDILARWHHGLRDRKQADEYSKLKTKLQRKTSKDPSYSRNLRKAEAATTGGFLISSSVSEELHAGDEENCGDKSNKGHSKSQGHQLEVKKESETDDSGETSDKTSLPALSVDLEEPTSVGLFPSKVAKPGYLQCVSVNPEGVLLAKTAGNSFRMKRNIAAETITSEGGVVAGKDVKLVCPPAAVQNPVYVGITLEDPAKFCGLLVQKELENDVMFCGPIINLQPNGHIFKKTVTLTTKLKLQNFKSSNILILHGTVARDGKIAWEDITYNSRIDETNAEINIEIDRFSYIVSLWRYTWIRAKDIICRLNLLAFNYTMSVLLNEDNNEIALLFVSQDVYFEQFYREHDTSALVQLTKEGFRELLVRSVDGQREKRIYNDENLQVSVSLGDDYKLTEREHGQHDLVAKSYVWWNTGHVIKLPLKKTKDIRFMCGKIHVKGEYGHTSEMSFCELDLHGYVRGLLDVKGAIFNLLPIAQMLEMSKDSIDDVIGSCKDEDEQLENILQQVRKGKDEVEVLKAFRKGLEGLQQEGYKVTERGQMHVRHLRDLATTILGLQHKSADLMKHISNQIQLLCKAVFRDCCIELEHSSEGVERAASSPNHVDYLKMHIKMHPRCRPIPEDVAKKYQQICSSSAECITEAFLSVIPDLIQTIKEIFVHEKISRVQNGLKGLSEETLAQYLSNVQDAERNNSVRQLVCEVCKIFEQLCLENCGKHSTTKIRKWGNSLAFLSMLDFLKRFFQHCKQDVKFHKRLELFSDHLRDIMSDMVNVGDEVFVRDFFNISLRLITFAKFDPSNLVRFELTTLPSSPVARIMPENVEYERHHDTFSQQFQITKNESEDELHFHAAASVHMDGRVCKIGAFQSVIKVSASGESVFDKFVARFSNVKMVKNEGKDSQNLWVVLCSSQKERLAEALDVLGRELSEDLIDLKRSKITQCHLAVRHVPVKEGHIVSLCLVYKWGSEAILLDSNDFKAVADFSANGACMPQVQLVGLQVPQMANEACEPLALTSGDENGFALDTVDPWQLQKHIQIHCERVEYHFHQTANYMKGHVCVVGDKTTLNEETPSQRALQEGPSSAPKRSITDGKGWQESTTL